MQTDPATLNRLAAECMEPMPTEPPTVPPEARDEMGDAWIMSPGGAWEYETVCGQWTLAFNPANSEADAVRFAEWFKRGPGKGCVVAFEWDGIEGTDTAAIQVMDSYGRTDMEHTVTTGPFPLALTTAILTALGKLEQSNDS